METCVGLFGLLIAVHLCIAMVADSWLSYAREFEAIVSSDSHRLSCAVLSVFSSGESFHFVRTLH